MIRFRKDPSIFAMALAVVASMGIAVPAWAELPQSIELGVFGGYDAKHATNELGNAKDKTEVPQAAGGLGVRAAYALMERLSAEVEAKYVFSKLKGSGDSAPILGLRGHALFNLLTEGDLRPFVRFGFGADILMTGSKKVVDQTDPDAATILGVGTRYAFTDELGVRLDLLGLVVPGRNREKVLEGEAWLGLYYTLGGVPRDTDGDGVIDKVDKCPTVAEDKDGWQDQDGCPDPDNDGDGILDAADKCPNEAEVKNGLKDEDGCPDGDKDGDGIEDSDDKCPTQAETKNGFQDEDGCPDDPDSDGDGILDSKDKCPKEPETKNGYQDEDGCPDVEPDTDGDGLVDSKDKCPKEPETKNGYQDDDGCPDVVPEKLKKFSGAIQGIVFETGSAKILPKSFKILDSAVAVLVEFKDTKLEIQGHTDDVGKPEDNKTLSLDRAMSVKAYFVGKGIAAERMSTVGYGQEKPVADNKTKAGKAKNRRIEFSLQ
jgi:outer membrane protein OmpA-like peptidoglycan-associated protein